MKTDKQETVDSLCPAERTAEELAKEARKKLEDQILDALPSVVGVHDKLRHLGDCLISQIGELQLQWRGAHPEEWFVLAYETALAIKPRNALECMLVTQMIGVHGAAVEMIRRAGVAGQEPEAIDANIARSSRLMRVFMQQLEALAKLRGEAGQQKVDVRHVHVNAGGQAIVGNVKAGRGRRG